MENPSSSTSSFKLLNRSAINSALSSFTKREWAIFTLFTITLFIGTLGILYSVNQSMMVEIPSKGGSVSEGIIGTPRFVNPVLANSPVDQDLVTLIYSGLMRKGPNDTFSLDLAEKYEMSENGLSYTFTLKENIYFHDGTPVIADDVVFTIDRVKNEIIKNPNKINWDSVSVEKKDDRTVVFNLKQTSPLFLENATLGILPKALWADSPIELNNANIEPIGSGPYMIKSATKQSSGSIDAYELVPFKKFALGEPYIKTLTLRFYPNEDELVKALLSGTINQASSITPENADILKEKKYKINSSVLPRVFGLFLNQNQNQLFIDKSVVNAINKAIDKDKIVRDVLYGYGTAIDSPIPPNMLAYQKLPSGEKISRDEILVEVKSDLAKAGWTLGEDGILEKIKTENKKKVITKLEFSISTGNTPELAETASIIQKDLAALGMRVDVKTFETGDLNQSVIRPRKYDALLFGQVINHESDLYAFWHSSQRKDPGLNVAMYTSAKVDKILEDAFVIVDAEERIKKYAQFEEEIRKDLPAVFIYSPNFIYFVSGNLKGIDINNLISPKDRFSNVQSWYINTENVWKIFAK